MPGQHQKETQQKPVTKKASKPVGNKTEKPQDKKPNIKSPGLSRDPSLEIKETVEESQSYFPVKQVDELLPTASSVDDFKDIKEMHSLPNETITEIYVLFVLLRVTFLYESNLLDLFD